MTAKLLSAPHILPIAPTNTVLHNHTLVLENDRIIDLLATDQALIRYPQAQKIDYPHHILMPGLINAHTHSAMTLFRGIADDLPLMTWLTEHIWPLEKRHINADTVYLGTQLAMMEMLQSGTTCFSDHYFYPEATAQATTEAGMRAIIGSLILNVPTQWAETEQDYLNHANAFLTQPRTPLMTPSLAPHDPFMVSNAGLSQIHELSQTHQVKVHMHVHESTDEIDHCLKNHGARPLQRLQSHQLLNSDLIAVHLTQCTSEDLTLLQQHHVSVVHCPSANYKLASGFCPTDKLLQRNINLCLGTDGPASNNSLNLFAEMKFAALLAKNYSQDPTCLPAEQALELATLNAARAYGLDDQIGSLEIGKQADVIAIDTLTPSFQPLHHPMSQLVYANANIHVTDVWVAGRPLLQNGQFTTLNQSAILTQVKAWQHTLGLTQDISL